MVGIASLLSIPISFGLIWVMQAVDSHTFVCPQGATICTLYPLGMGNGNPSFNVAGGQNVTSILISRTIQYPMQTSTSETTTSINSTNSTQG